MQDNPYATLLSTMRTDAAEHSVAPWRLGRVTGVSPLTVEVGGFALSGAELLVNPVMLERGEDIALSGLSGSLDMAEVGGAVGGGSLSGSARLGGILAAGDRVVLLQSGDGQQYVVLCKVVSG